MQNIWYDSPGCSVERYETKYCGSYKCRSGGEGDGDSGAARGGAGRGGCNG